MPDTGKYSRLCRYVVGVCRQNLLMVIIPTASTEHNNWFHRNSKFPAIMASSASDLRAPQLDDDASTKWIFCSLWAVKRESDEPRTVVSGGQPPINGAPKSSFER